MGEKNKKNNKAAENEEVKKEDNDAMITMVFKTEMHCEGCASKILKYVKSIQGVEKAKTEWEANKLTVLGEVDPLELRDMLLEKTKKKVELVSPQVKKEKENKGNNSSNKNNKSNNENKAWEKENKAEDKKPKEKEPPVMTVDLKVDFHCSGCIVKMHKFISKSKGIQNITINKEKNLITLKGTMDVKEIAQNLRDRMKRQVEIVVPKKEKDGDGGKGAEKEGRGGGGDGKKKKKKGGGGDDGGDGGNKEEAEIDGKMEGNRSEYYGPLVPQGYGAIPTPIYGYPYGYMYGHPLHAPQMFSDENPNACSVM